MDSRRFRGQSAWRPVASSGILCRPVNPCGAGLDPLQIKILDSGCLDAWMLDAGRIGIRGLLDGRRGLEGRPTRLSLEELDGFCVIIYWSNYFYMTLLRLSFESSADRFA